MPVSLAHNEMVTPSLGSVARLQPEGGGRWSIDLSPELLANENGRRPGAGRLVLPTGHLQRCFGQPFALHLDPRCLGGDLGKIGSR
jgi:hypothetical protein